METLKKSTRWPEDLMVELKLTRSSFPYLRGFLELIKWKTTVKTTQQNGWRWWMNLRWRSEGAELTRVKQPASSCTTDDVQFVRNEYFCIGPATMKKLFEPVLNGIVKHLNNLLEHRELRGLQFFFLVGGFAESAILQDAIKKNFQRR